MRSGVPHVFRDLRLEPREVLTEEIGESFRLLVVGSFVLPGAAGIQELARDAWHFDGDVQAEEGVLARLGAVELTPDHGAHHLAGGGDVDAASDAVGTAGPSGVYEVTAGAVLLEPLGEHLGVS